MSKNHEQVPLTTPIYHNKHPEAPRLDPEDNFATFYLLQLTDAELELIQKSKRIRVGLQLLPNGRLFCAFEAVHPKP